MNKYKDYCKLIIATRINKHYESDTFINDIENNNTFTPIHISKTYS